MVQERVVAHCYLPRDAHPIPFPAVDQGAWWRSLLETLWTATREFAVCVSRCLPTAVHEVGARSQMPPTMSALSALVVGGFFAGYWTTPYFRWYFHTLYGAPPWQLTEPPEGRG